MGLTDLVSRQLSHPTGVGGRIIARLMNRGNATMNARARALLEVDVGHHVLDLGFGGGLSLGPLLADAAQVTALDRAPDMVQAARVRHADDVAAGRLVAVVGDIDALPFDDGSFDRVLTVNTVYFWPDLPAALAEVRRTLAPGGRLVIAIRDGSVMEQVNRDIFTVRPAQEIVDATATAGFTGVRLVSADDRKTHFIVADH